MVKPIFITGIHRSGSTWVGRLLSQSPQVVYIHEPFRPGNYRPGACNFKFNYWYTYITGENESYFLPALKNTLALRYDLVASLKRYKRPKDVLRVYRRYFEFLGHRLHHRVAMLKDPFAVLSAEWLVDRFGMNPLVLMRHPAAFAEQLILQGWDHPFHDFLNQPLLMEQHLQPFEAEIAHYARCEMPIIDQACLLWRIIYTMVGEYQLRHPAWNYRRYEDIARDPRRHAKELFDRFGLNDTHQVEQAIADATDEQSSETATQAWRDHLSPKEITYIRQRVEDISCRYYSDEDW